jgi:hypothetical protein
MEKHTLLIHHLEETWRRSLEGYGLTLEAMSMNIIDYLHSPDGRKINDVIFTRFEEFDACDSQLMIIDYLKARGIAYTHQVFGYGQFEEMFEGQGYTLIPATRPDADEGQVVEIEDWHLDLAKSLSISLCGAFEDQCIQDAEDMLTHVRGEGGYSRLSSLIAGSYETYIPHYDPEVFYTKGRKLISTYERNIQSGRPAGPMANALERDLQKLCSEPGFQIFAKYMQSDEVGYLHSEIEQINEALEAAISCININKMHRELDGEPSFHC